MTELPTEFDRLLVRFLVATGLRFGELQELRWKDVDLSGHPKVRVSRQYTRVPGKGVVVAMPKTSKGVREIPLSPQMALELAARAGDSDQLVFAAPRGGYIDRPNYHGRMLKPAGRRAGVPWVGWHTMRHTCASLLFAAAEPDSSGFRGGGKNVKQVQQWLGHATPAFTLERYVHLLDGGVGDADFFDGIV